MLAGKKILITSGPTRSYLDAVRYLSNVSTGRFGTLLAEAALRSGARVTMIYGKESFTPRNQVRLKKIEVETYADLSRQLCFEIKSKKYDAVIHAMAVLDFQPARLKKIKTKTRRGLWRLELVPTPKLITQIKKWDPNIFLVGFKLEVGLKKTELLRRARKLLQASKADRVLANQLTAGDDRKHTGFLLDAAGLLIAQASGKESLAKLLLYEMEKSCDF